MKILIGMSGGVDSAASARILIDKGNCVEGAVILMHEYTELSCAETACKELGIKLHVIDARDTFSNIVKENFVSEYSKGRTPNPCIICNERIKFRFLCDYAMENGFDAIATGHYAKITELSDERGIRYAVTAADDLKKDQSYMLYRLPQDILSKLILPLSELNKAQVRDIAKENNISAADREDSQEICFLPDGKYADYIESILGEFPCGSFIDEQGRVLGEHKGIIRYTVGQRKGLGISLGERAFVTEIDPMANTVTLSPAYMGKRVIELHGTVFSGLREPAENMSLRAAVKIRYSAAPSEATIELDTAGGARMIFDAPVKAAKGQSAVVYDGEGRVLFGGFID